MSLDHHAARPALRWLPPPPADWRARLRALPGLPPAEARAAVRDLARHDLDFVQTNALDRLAAASFPHDEPDRDSDGLRLAILGSSTTTHLHAGIRIAALRRGLRVQIHETDFNQYRQDLLDPASQLHRFRPGIVLFALDAAHLCGALPAGATAVERDAALDATLSDLAALWAAARDDLGAVVLQQLPLPVLPALMGDNEHRLPGSPASFVDRLSAQLRDHADGHGVHLLALDHHVRRYGIAAWHDPVMWHRARQEVALPATPFYGDLVARLLAALRGRSSKVLVLDLDDTLWGGVIGDDGLENIVLGSNSAAGEGFLAVQRYADDLAQRGVALAVCSKNDAAVAMRAFDHHPEMVLRRDRIASFVADWNDKATNLRRIAAELDVGLDALVFLDDNPFERDLVRRTLPEVAVPEVPPDPALVPGRLAEAGYFESVRLTAEDRERTGQYQANRVRRELAGTATDLDSYLRALAMRLCWSVLSALDLPRAAQLVNKTNQFNLTGRRRDEAALQALRVDPDALVLVFRLLDRFGDNGLIGVVIGHHDGSDLHIDTWLMSCRVLGRGVEDAMLAVLAAAAVARGATALIGEYRPSGRNAMVAGLYPRLGFAPLPGTAATAAAGEAPQEPSRYRLDLERRPAPPDTIEIIEETRP